jgi:hypothetical protein
VREENNLIGWIPIIGIIPTRVFAQHFYVLDAVFQVYVAGLAKAERCIKIFEITLCSDAYGAWAVERKEGLNAPFHQLLSESHMSGSRGSYDPADRSFPIGNARGYQARVGDQPAIQTTHQVMRALVFVVEVLERATLLHHKDCTSELQDLVEFKGRKLVKRFAGPYCGRPRGLERNVHAMRWSKLVYQY